MRVGVGPALVGEDGDGDVLVGQPADRRAGAQEAARVAERRMAGDRDRLDAEPVGDARLVRRGPQRCRRPSRRASPARARQPPYRARAQWTRSLEVEAIEPAAPAAVTTEVNGATRGAVGQVDGRQLRVGADEAVVPHERTLRLLHRLVERAIETERGEEAGPELLGDRAATDRLGDQAEDEVVGVRVVPRRARLGVRLADVGQRTSRIPDAGRPGQQRLVDARVEVEVAQPARVVEELADRDLPRDAAASAGTTAPMRRGRAGRPRRGRG